MVILVTGANGQLGNEMRILAKNSTDKYIFTDVIDASEESVAMLKKLVGDGINSDTEHLDITNLDAIREIVKRENVEAIVNCAAYTNVDAAEDNYDLAEFLNAKAPENLAIAMKEVDGWFRSLRIMCLVKNHTIPLVRKTRRVLPLECMEQQSCLESRRLLPQNVNI